MKTRYSKVNFKVSRKEGISNIIETGVKLGFDFKGKKVKMVDILVVLLKKLMPSRGSRTCFPTYYEKRYIEEVKLQSSEQIKDVAKEPSKIEIIPKSEAQQSNQQSKTSTSSAREQELDVFLLGGESDEDPGISTPIHFPNFEGMFDYQTCPQNWGNDTRLTSVQELLGIGKFRSALHNQLIGFSPPFNLASPICLVSSVAIIPPTNC
ncbi:hypothetical protein LWI29_036074 [Acer saccharum]|uniref:Uncharacterized protein n=1 Tax=Acer saccharum TaxID=4024 RepID=A0AA39SPR3_ACESA|nr:hypothetical protein LWI29_036074 [Acer saccharum]